jgi:hypothetical protein
MYGSFRPYDKHSNTGYISGDDSRRYKFSISDVLNLPENHILDSVTRVEFVPTGDLATKIVIAAPGDAAELPEAAQTAQLSSPVQSSRSSTADEDEVNVMPNSIKYFERSFLFPLVFGLLFIILSFLAPNLLSEDMINEYLISILAIILSIVLVLLTSRKRSVIARNILVALVALNFISYLQVLRGAFGQDIAENIEVFFPGVVLLLQFFGVYMLSTVEGRKWTK